MPANHPTDAVLRRLLRATGAVAAELRRKLLALAKRPLPAAVYLAEARRLVRQYEPLVERSLRDAMLAAYLKPAAQVLPQLPDAATPSAAPTASEKRPEYAPDYARPTRGLSPAAEPAGPSGLVEGGYAFDVPPILPPPFGPGPPPLPPVGEGAPEPPPLVRFPAIERGAQQLAEKRIYRRSDFDQLDVAAKREAFTVARVQSIGTLTKIRDAVVRDVREGGTLETFRERIADATADIPLTPQHSEVVYRTNLMASYSAGQRALLDHPLVSSATPYAIWRAVHDDRVRPDHLAMETAGLDGSACFRSDDPLIRQCWPPAAYNCRCFLQLATLEQAAALGVKEAQRWLATGKPPENPAYVASVPILVPAGWVGGVGAVQLSAAHAPKGGVNVGGKDYPGGEFVPKGTVGGMGGGDENFRATRAVIARDYPEAAAMTPEQLDAEFDTSEWKNEIADQVGVYRRLAEGDTTVPDAFIVNDPSKRAGVYRASDGSLWVVWSRMEEHVAYSRPMMRPRWAVLENPPFYFRWTNNKGEDRILKGFRSTDHSTDRKEDGMSVAPHPDYQGMFSTYSYGYVVTGRVIGHGADGEPILQDVKALTPPAPEIPKKYMDEYRRFLADGLASWGLAPGDYRALANLKPATATPGGLTFLYPLS